MIHDLASGFTLRRATAADHGALLAICLRTGDSGADATGLDAESDMIGLYYAVPYQVLEPEFCFLIERAGTPMGYVMGTPRTGAFERRFAAEWLPRLRARFAPPPDDERAWTGFDWLRHRIHHAEQLYPPALHGFPAQAHIDLLPPARGQGVGRAAMRHLMNSFVAAGAPGLHLHVSPHNFGAQAFYRRLGFVTLHDSALPAHTVFMARTLP